MRALLPAVAMTLYAASAAAHVADEIVVTYDEKTREETITMTAETLAMLAPIDADSDGELTQRDLDARADALRAGVWDQAKLEPCTRSKERATLEPGYVALRARFACGPGELTQEFRWLLVLPSNYRVLFGTQVAKGDTRTLHLRSAPERAPDPRPAWRPWAPLVALALGAALACFKRTRWPGLAIGLFAAGFWLVERLVT